ncbi:MAG: hypothetical protein ABJA85_06150 [Bacteroidota bacterium]
MYQELYHYLIEYKQLPVPGIGTFLLEKTPAGIDFPNKKINPPEYAVALDPLTTPPTKNFFTWLGDALHISDQEAVVRFNDFSSAMKKQVVAGDIIDWDGVGIISNGLAGGVKFIPGAVLLLEKPIVAEKVLREKAGHMVRVGEDQKTSEEMTEMLNKPEEKKSYWWVSALAIILLAVMFIGWYISEHGIDISSTGNEMKSIPLEATATYQLIP